MAGRSTTKALLLGGAAAVSLGAAGYWWFGIERREVYTDGGVLQLEADGQPPRDIMWRPPESLGEAINTEADEGSPAFHPDGGLAVFTRPSDAGDTDLLLARRRGGAWDGVEPVAQLNTPDNEFTPAFSADGGWLYFASDRPGGEGGTDLWRVAVGRDAGGLSFGIPEPMGAGVNSPSDEFGPAPSPALEGRPPELLFSSDRPRALSVPDETTGEPVDPGVDIYRLTLDGAAQLVAPLSSDGDDLTPAWSPVGDFVYFASDREGGIGGLDLYRARFSADDGFGVPMALDASVNTSADELEPSLGMEGFELRFSSDREGSLGGSDLFRSVSREVYLRRTTVYAGLWGELLALLPWILAALAIVLLLAMLRRLATGGVWARQLETLGLMARCVLASLILHAALMALLAFWTVEAVPGTPSGDRGVRVALSSAAARSNAVSQLRGAITEANMERAESPESERPDVAMPELDVSSAQMAPAMDAPAARAIDAAAVRTSRSESSRSAAAQAFEVSETNLEAEDVRAADVATPAAVAATLAREAPTPTAEREAARVDRPEAALDGTTSIEVATTLRPGGEIGETRADGLDVEASFEASASTASAESFDAAALESIDPVEQSEIALAAPEVAGVEASAEFDAPIARSEVAPVGGPSIRGNTDATADSAELVPQLATGATDGVAVEVASSDSAVVEAAAALEPLPAIDLGVPDELALDFSTPATEGAATTDLEADARAERALASVLERDGPVIEGAAVDVTADVAEFGVELENLDADDLALATDEFEAAAPIATGDVFDLEAPPSESLAMPELEALGFGVPEAIADPAGPDGTDPEVELARAEIGETSRDQIEVPLGGEEVVLASVTPDVSAEDDSVIAFESQAGEAEPALGFAEDLPGTPLNETFEIVIADPTLAIPAPFELLARYRLGGEVLDAATDEPLAGAIVRLDLEAGAGVQVATDSLGEFAFSVDDMPENAALTASVDGYVPGAINVVASELEDGEFVVLRLRRENPGTIALEAIPEVHHLGDDDFSGSINSQFQRASEGDELDLDFAIGSAQLRAAREPELRMFVKGSQLFNRVLINGRMLDQPIPESPDDGSFGEVALEIPPDILRRGGNTVRVRSAYRGSDADDFEFVNLRIVLDPAAEDAVPLAAMVARGVVIDDESGDPIRGAVVRLDLDDEGVRPVRTGRDGTFSIGLMNPPDQLAISASALGYEPLAIGVAARVIEQGARLVFRLEPESLFEIALEDEPEVHHLGNDDFSGSINSRFQRESEGLEANFEFTLRRDQLPPNVRRAAIELLVKGSQAPNPIEINGVRLPETLRRSPADGRFAAQRLAIPLRMLRPGENTVTIRSVAGTADLDDFEFINARIILTPSGRDETQ